MTPLRKRLIDDLYLAGYAHRTVQSYTGVVVQLAKHFGRSPDEITEEELRLFFVHLKEQRNLSDSSFKQYISGIKFFYEKTLNRKWELFDLVRPRKSRKLPIALAHEEVKKLLQEVRLGDCRMALILIYSCGLRLQECMNLKVADVDGSRKMLRVDQGKGAKDRYIPIPDRTLELLRGYWLAYHPQGPLFPSPRNSEQPMHPNRLQKVFKTVVTESGATAKKATIHTLRHSYATRLLENGVNLKQLKELLGHNSISTTLRYTHLTSQQSCNVREKINQLMSDL